MLSKLETLIHAPTVRLRNWLRRWDETIVRELLAGRVRATPEGMILLDTHRLRGEFFHRVRGRDTEFACDHNLIVDQGIMKALGILFYTDAKLANWYLSMFTGSTTPVNSLTATSYPATQAEITSTTEGYSNATRPAFTAAAPVANVINNTASQAAFNIVCATSIHVTGSGVHSDNTRGGTSGTLWSAGLWSAPRDLFNGEVFDLGYQTSLTD